MTILVIPSPGPFRLEWIKIGNGPRLASGTLYADYESKIVILFLTHENPRAWSATKIQRFELKGQDYNGEVCKMDIGDPPGPEMEVSMGFYGGTVTQRRKERDGFYNALAQCGVILVPFANWLKWLKWKFFFSENFIANDNEME